MLNLGCCSIILFLIISIACACSLLGASMAYVAENVINSESELSEFRENTTVILKEVNNFIISSVNVTEDTEHIGDFDHHIDVYQLGLRCTDLPQRNNFYTTTDTNLERINKTMFYALANSYVSFSICGKSNLTKVPERLEIVLSTSAPQQVKFIYPGTDNKWNCRNFTFNIKKPDYYTIIFLPPTYPTSFEYDATYMIKEIDPKRLYEHTRFVDNYTLHEDHDTHTFRTKFEFVGYSCFAATVRDNPDTSIDIVHVQLYFTVWFLGFIICFVVVTLFFSVSGVFIISTMVCYRRCK